MTIKITLNHEYGTVLFVVLTFALYLTLVGFKYGGGGRREIFHFENMQKFQEEHKKAFGGEAELCDRGYPDNGSGRYSKNLTYKEWFDFNSNQRIHGNLLDIGS